MSKIEFGRTKNDGKMTKHKSAKGKMKGEKQVLIAKVKSVRKVLFSIQPIVLLLSKEITNQFDVLPSSFTNLLKEYQDVFLDKILSGLPPLRGIEHQIDLIPGASLPNRPLYRTSPEETKEIQYQVEDLLSKG